ncbi:MAG: TetR/AcrR family transcriptional regulator [Hyphomicrobiales bacterium]|nr:TetR/AcrR family transcriptional regulator [Hyphomicrobiales bacterium]MCP4998586.1 TetR/AcrR family transcriptional regulator [Hyphomicrobiales bacterium]
MPWEKAYNESEVLERAMHAFWRHGYEATSMSDLVAATGINRGSIYAAYTNKHRLFLEALRHYDRVHRAEFLTRVTLENSPKEAILTAFESAARGTGADGSPPGCLLVNTALELSPHDDEVRDFVDEALKQVEAFFFDNIEAAKRSGSVNRSLPARPTAQALLGLFLGLRVLARSKPRNNAINAITSQARAMLD